MTPLAWNWSPDILKSEFPPSGFYTSPEVWNACRSNVFARSWQFVSAVQAAPGPGDAYPFTFMPGLVSLPLLLLRGNDDQVRCLSNVCTHRANLLVAHASRIPAIRCLYHGRRFGLDGKVESAPGFESCHDFPTDKDHLASYPLHDFGKWLFASPDPQMPFDEWISPVLQRVGWLPFHEFSIDDENTEYLVNAHWALYVENYLEGFHIPFVHGRSLNPHLEKGTYRTETFPWGVLQTGFALPDEPAFDLPEHSADYGKRVAAYYFWLFPNLMLNFYPWGLSVNIVLPRERDRSLVRYLTYTWKPKLKEQGAGADLDFVEREDDTIVERVQSGIVSGRFSGGRYSPEHETGPHAFHGMMRSCLKDYFI